MNSASGRLGVRRALLMLTLLAGLFAMHGLTANHDTALFGVDHQQSSSRPQVAAASTMHESHGELGDPATTPPLLVVAAMVHANAVATEHTARPAGEPRHGGHTGGEMCMAILMAALALTLLLAAARTRSAMFIAAPLLACSRHTFSPEARSRVHSLSLIQLNLSRT